MNKQRQNQTQRFLVNICNTNAHSVYDFDSFEWLCFSYEWKYGLRNWNWQAILNGIVEEHKNYFKSNRADGDYNDKDFENIEMIWKLFLKLAGVKDLQRVPVTDDPNHEDVKTILYIYSMESFLYNRIN